MIDAIKVYDLLEIKQGFLLGTMENKAGAI